MPLILEKFHVVKLVYLTLENSVALKRNKHL